MSFVGLPRSTWEISHEHGRTRRGLSGQTTLPWHALRLCRAFASSILPGPGESRDRQSHSRTGGHVPSWPGCSSATWLLRDRVLTGLYRFAISRGYVGSSPLPTTLPKLPPQQTPYVYSTEELRRLLDATEALRVGHSPQVPAMYRTLILLLYGTGMRIGEVLRLTLQDVDLTEQVIAIRDTKFFKTRLVPIGPRLHQELARHTERRRLLPLPGGRRRPYSPRAMDEHGTTCASSRGFRMFAELQVSFAHWRTPAPAPA